MSIDEAAALAGRILTAVDAEEVPPDLRRDIRALNDRDRLRVATALMDAQERLEW